LLEQVAENLGEYHYAEERQGSGKEHKGERKCGCALKANLPGEFESLEMVPRPTLCFDAAG